MTLIPQEPPPSPAPKTVLEQIKERFTTWARSTMDDFGEPRSLALAIDWQDGAEALPPGLMVARKGDKTESRILPMSGQLVRLTEMVMRNQQLNYTMQVVRLQKLKQEVEKLERRKRELTTPGRADGPAVAA